jgi:hypothetical protein
MRHICMNNRDKEQHRIPLIFKLYLILILFTPSMAYAYVDPGTGSVIVTSVLGFIAAIGYTFRKYFYKLKRKIFGNKTEDD